MNQQESTVSHGPAPLLVTVVEAARLLGIGRSKLYELIGNGIIPTVLVGRARRVPVASLTDFVDALVMSTEMSPHPTGTLRATSPFQVTSHGSAM